TVRDRGPLERQEGGNGHREGRDCGQPQRSDVDPDPVLWSEERQPHVEQQRTESAVKRRAEPYDAAHDDDDCADHDVRTAAATLLARRGRQCRRSGVIWSRDGPKGPWTGHGEHETPETVSVPDDA